MSDFISLGDVKICWVVDKNKDTRRYRITSYNQPTAHLVIDINGERHNVCGYVRSLNKYIDIKRKIKKYNLCNSCVNKLNEMIENMQNAHISFAQHIEKVSAVQLKNNKDSSISVCRNRKIEI